MSVKPEARPAKHVFEFDNGEMDWIVAESEAHAWKLYRKLYGRRTAPSATCRQVPDCRPLTIRFDGAPPDAEPSQTQLASRWAAETEPGLLGSTVI